MYPSYLNFTISELKRRKNIAFERMESCRTCPRECQVNRIEDQRGFCRLGKKAMVSSYHSHFGEEECLVGKYGSGTIFFTCCNLSCIYCQNYEISQLGIGQEIEDKDLAEILLKIQSYGCHNINLVTPTPQAPQILSALLIAIQKGLKLPFVYNTSGYDSVETLKILAGIVDIYLPDFKYSDEVLAKKYSFAPAYPEIAKKALKEMHRQVGDLIIGKDGIAKRGLLVRHLVLPENIAGTKEIVKFLAKEISKNTFVNIMDQYRPYFKANDFPPLDRRITPEEYSKARELAQKAGLKRIYPPPDF